jgi:hypothetical protein
MSIIIRGNPVKYVWYAAMIIPVVVAIGLGLAASQLVYLRAAVSHDYALLGWRQSLQ